MYSISILIFIMFIPFVLGLTLLVHDYIVSPSRDGYLKTHEVILMIISIVLCLAFIMIDSYENLSEEIGSSKQALALNAFHRPMYDINSDVSNGTYRVYLKSGKTKTVSPKVVHVNRSKGSYLKTTRRLHFTNIFGLKFKADTYTENTLYLNDK